MDDEYGVMADQIASDKGPVFAITQQEAQMLARVNQVATVAQHGLVVQLRDGPSIYFGAPDRLAAKWLSATAVLADPGSAGALYIDVTVPDHPAAGAGSAPSTVAGPITPTATTAGASTTPVGG